MGMLQKYRNKLRADERKKKRKLVEDGEVETRVIKVKVPGIKRNAK